MSVLERRLQVLLDTERFELLEAEAARTGRSIGAIVRDAIDVHFASDDAGRAAAGARLLAATEDVSHAEPDWSTTKQELQSALDERLR